MKHAYALLGLAFLIVFVAAYLLMEKAHAPTEDASDQKMIEVEI